MKNYWNTGIKNVMVGKNTLNATIKRHAILLSNLLYAFWRVKINAATIKREIEISVAGFPTLFFGETDETWKIAIMIVEMQNLVEFNYFHK